MLVEGHFVVLFVQMRWQLASSCDFGARLFQEVVTTYISDFEIVAFFCDELLALLCEAFRIERATIDYDFYTLLVQHVQCLLEAVPGRRFPSVMLASMHLLGILCEIHLRQVVSRDEVNVSLCSLPSHLVARIAPCA